MHHFDPTKSYKGCDEFGNTALAVAESYLLGHRFYESTGQSLKVQPRVQVTISLPMDWLQYLLDHIPGAFGDVPPATVEEMDDGARKQHEDFLAALEDPESHAAKFAAWFSSR